MDEQKPKNHSKYIFIILFILIIILSFKIIQPFITSILTAIVLAFIFYPLHDKLNKKVKNKSLSSSIMLIIIFLIILTPLVLAANILMGEAIHLYLYVKNLDVTLLAEPISKYLPAVNTEEYIKEALKEISSVIVNTLRNFVLSVPKLLLNLFIILFTLFYLFKDKERIFMGIKRILPIEKKHQEELINKFRVVTKAIIDGILITAVVQGIAGAIGFYIFKLPNPLLAGFIMAILSILAVVPIIGPFLVWFPAAVYLILTGNLINGILLLAYGSLVISTIDNILKPRLISKKTNIHPILILLGLIGGVNLFGIIGVVLGPLILSYLIVFTRFYQEKHSL